MSVTAAALALEAVLRAETAEVVLAVTLAPGAAVALAALVGRLALVAAVAVADTTLVGLMFTPQVVVAVSACWVKVATEPVAAAAAVRLEAAAVVVVPAGQTVLPQRLLVLAAQAARTVALVVLALRNLIAVALRQVLRLAATALGAVCVLFGPAVRAPSHLLAQVTNEQKISWWNYSRHPGHADCNVGTGHLDCVPSTELHESRHLAALSRCAYDWYGHRHGSGWNRQCHIYSPN